MRQSKPACTTARFRRRVWLYPLVTLCSFGFGFWLLMNVATPPLCQHVDASDQAAVAGATRVIEPNGQIVSLRRASFKIYMGCEGCASTLRTVFLGLPGVHAASIDIRHKTTTVLYDPTRSSERAIQAKIPNAWYYTPHLSSDVAMALTSASSSPTVQASTMAGILALLAGLLAMTSGAI